MISVAVKISRIIKVALSVPDTGACPGSTVENSDNTFHQAIPSGGTLILADTIYNVFVNGILGGSTAFPSMADANLNIIL